MLKNLATMLISAAFLVGASSCASRVETFKTYPPAADMTPAGEPAYPLAALGVGEQAVAAEKAWWNAVLVWGRGESAKVGRICNWAKVLGYPTPKGMCDAR